MLLADPAWGNRTMTIAEFEKAWIEYLKIGRVGFVVQAPPDSAAGVASRLAPRASDFVTLN